MTSPLTKKVKERLGYFDKYEVTKRDGTPTDSNACYFVLRLDTDKDAVRAAMKYATLKGNEDLYKHFQQFLTGGGDD